MLLQHNIAQTGVIHLPSASI